MEVVEPFSNLSPAPVEAVIYFGPEVFVIFPLISNKVVLTAPKVPVDTVKLSKLPLVPVKFNAVKVLPVNVPCPALAILSTDVFNSATSTPSTFPSTLISCLNHELLSNTPVFALSVFNKDKLPLASISYALSLSFACCIIFPIFVYLKYKNFLFYFYILI